MYIHPHRLFKGHITPSSLNIHTSVVHMFTPCLTMHIITSTTQHTTVSRDSNHLYTIHITSLLISTLTAWAINRSRMKKFLNLCLPKKNSNSEHTEQVYRQFTCQFKVHHANTSLIITNKKTNNTHEPWCLRLLHPHKSTSLDIQLIIKTTTTIDPVLY